MLIIGKMELGLGRFCRKDIPILSQPQTMTAGMSDDCISVVFLNRLASKPRPSPSGGDKMGDKRVCYRRVTNEAFMPMGDKLVGTA